MTDNLNYISDDELERLICQIEENELVAAPPDLMDSILEAAELMDKPPAKVTTVPAASRKKRIFCLLLPGNHFGGSGGGTGVFTAGADRPDDHKRNANAGACG